MVADAADVHGLQRVPVQALEKTHVLELHRRQEALGAPAVGRRHGLPNQPLADLVLAAVAVLHPQPPAVPDSRFLLQDPHHPHHPEELGGPGMDGGNGVGAIIPVIAVVLFEEVLLLAEDGAAQLPVALHQWRGGL